MKKNIFTYVIISIFVLVNAGCFNDLNTVPLDDDIISASVVYTDAASYKKVLAKLYAGLAVSGQEGPAGVNTSDIEDIDEGFGQYLRGYWYHQELPTDEAIIGWNDQTIKDFHQQDWTEIDGFIYAFYSRIFYQVTVSTEFIRETTDEKLAERNTSEDLKAQIKQFRAEARFLRALSYWHALDLFRNVPFVTENDKVGAFFPQQTNAVDLSKYIESELLAIENEMAAPKTNEYGRADRAAVWSLLAKLYLNQEVYTGEKKYNECLVVCEKILSSGYSLDPVYQNLFLADNHLSPEIIFPIAFDGVNTKTWGGTTFIVRAGIGGSMDPSDSGVASGWGGVRTTKEFVRKFPENTTGVIISPNDGKIYQPLYVFGTHQDTAYNIKETFRALTSPTNNKIFEGHQYFPANSEFVFALNPTLGGALGDNGADGKLETGGAKIKVAEEGFYYIKVDRNTGKNTYTLEKRNWKVVGSAVTTGNNSFIYDKTKKALVAKLELSEGVLQFVANDNSATTLGDNGADALLETNGTPIKIDKSGGYEIILYVDKPDYTLQMNLTSFDRRGHFYKDGQSLEINDESLFTDGIAINKFKNITSTGQRGSNSDHPDTDFPVFRLADIYLMAAEAILRNNGDKNKALEYVNKVRERAHTGKAGNLSLNELSLDFILEERARELYWECHRRTDLVRFGQFTDGSYVWAWKGGVKEGKTVGNYRNIYPIPASDKNANPNLKQNEGY